jgi:hypothetical protein
MDYAKELQALQSQANTWTILCRRLMQLKDILQQSATELVGGNEKRRKGVPAAFQEFNRAFERHVKELLVLKAEIEKNYQQIEKTTVELLDKKKKKW